MQLPSAIAAGSVAIALFAGGFAIGHGVSDDSGSSSDKPQVLGKVFTPDTSTTSTTAASSPALTQAPQAPPASTAPSAASTATTAPQTTPATALQATVTTAPPSTTPASAAVNPQCGNGSAAARLSASTQPRDLSANTDYQSNITVDVDNGINQPIQLDSLSVRVTLEDGRVTDVVFSNAPGTVIQPGNTGHFAVTINTGKSPAKTFAMSSFAFHTAGHPECPGRAA